MSLDERVRASFEVHDEVWDYEAGPALRRVRETARHRSVVRRRLVAAAVAAVVLPTALVIGTRDTIAPEPGAPAAPAPAPSPGQPPDHDSTQPLDGLWRSEPISEDDVRRTLEEAGLGRWSDPILRTLPARPFVAEMRIRDRRVNLYLVPSDGEPQEYDGQETNVVDDQLRLTAIWSRVATGYRWSAETRGTGGDAVTVLDLDLEATTEHDREGIPGEVWQRVLYTSEEFVGEGRWLDGQTQ